MPESYSCKNYHLISKECEQTFSGNIMIEEFLKCMIRAGGYIVIVYNDFADKALERPDILLNELSKAAFIVRILMSFASVNIVIAEKLLKQNEELLNIVKGSVV